jgi:stearoyl-CoA desaturase (delta-9 desaturase)
MGPIQGAIVNYAGHKFGYRNFDLGDNSKNTLPVDFLLMGELYQNNHHKNGKRMNFAYRYFEIDITYQIAKLLHVIGIIKIKGNIT